MENDVADPNLVLKTTIDSRLTRAVCFKSVTVATYKRKRSPHNLQQKTDIETFKTRAVQWTNYEHEYSTVLERNDWSKSEIYTHMNCKSSFFKGTVLGNKDVKILSFDNLDVDTTVSNESISSPSPSICSIMPGRSKVISLGYTSSLDEKYCVICNKVQYKATTRAPLLLRTLDLKKHGDDLNEAEKTSIEFANIHKEKGTKYADAGERILLSLNTISAFFPTDAAFHAKCYHTFRSPSWKIESKNQSRRFG